MCYGKHPDTTGDDERGMCGKGWPGNLREPPTPRRRATGQVRRTGLPKGQAQAGTPMPVSEPRGTRTKLGADRGIGKRVTSGATREGEAVVLAERSTDGRDSGREGGEVRPKRPTVGKVKPGITFCRGEK